MTANLKLVPSWPASLIGDLKLEHEDDRRAIRESNHRDFSIQYFTVKKRCALGNHYHTGKSETFVILKGEGMVITRSVDVNGKPVGQVFQTKITIGNVIVINPFQAHTFVLEEGSEMLNYSSAPYDENNKDMTASVLVDPRTLVVVVDTD